MLWAAGNASVPEVIQEVVRGYLWGDQSLAAQVIVAANREEVTT